MDLDLVAKTLIASGLKGKGPPTDENGFLLPLTPQTSDAESDIDFDHSSNDGSKVFF